MSGGDFWDDPTDHAEVRGGRYQLADPVTGKSRSWTRASNISSAVDNPVGLHRWNMRNLVRGIAQRSDLLTLLSAAVDLGNDKVDEIIAAASEVVGEHAKANEGTAVHEVQRRVDLGLPIPEGMEHWADGYRTALERYGLVPVAVEVLLLNRALAAAGRADRIYRERSGAYVIGDTKTTDHLDLAQAVIAVQLATYAGSEWVDSRGLVGDLARFGADTPHPSAPAWSLAAEVVPLRTDYAIVMHTDRGTGAVAAYEVDLRAGAYGANLADQVREYRKSKTLRPYAPATARDREVLQLAVLDPVPPADYAVSMDQAEAVPDPFAEIIPDDQAVAEMVDSVQGVTIDPVLVQIGPAAGGLGTITAAGAVCLTCTRPQQDRAALMKMTKGQLQDMCRAHSLGHLNLARNRGPLVDYLRDAGHVLGEAIQHPNPGQQTTAKVKPGTDPAELAGDPEDPHSPQYQRAILRRLEQANGVSEVIRINQEVNRRGGDQAWTDDMARTARDTVKRFHAIDDAASATQRALPRIAACVTLLDLRDLWDSVTIGGTVPEWWTPELNHAAQERRAQITAAAGPAPANPFAEES